MFGESAWLTKPQARRPHCAARGQKPPLSRAGPCGFPTASTAGRPPEHSLLSAATGAWLMFTFLISLSLVEFPPKFIASFPVRPHRLPWVVMFAVPAAATDMGTGELLGPLKPQTPNSYSFHLFLHF